MSTCVQLMTWVTLEGHYGNTTSCHEKPAHARPILLLDSKGLDMRLAVAMLIIDILILFLGGVASCVSKHSTHLQNATQP